MTDLDQKVLWDIQRYLLDDPSFDRHAFEQQMLEDPSLALAVADEVESLEAIQATLTTSPQPTGFYTILHHKQLNVALGMAVAVLLVVGLSQVFVPSNLIETASTTSAEASRPLELEETVDYWLGFDEGSASAENLDQEALVFDSPAFPVSFEAESELLPSDEADPADSDWMLEIAIGYFGEMDS